MKVNPVPTKGIPMRLIIRSISAGPAAIAICCALLVAALAGSASAGVSPLTAVKKQLKATTKIAKGADKRAKGADNRAKGADTRAKLALVGPPVVAASHADVVSLASGSFTNVVSVTLTAGRWTIEGGAQVNNNTSTGGARDDCRLASGASMLLSRSTGLGGNGSGDYSAIIPLSAVINLPAGGTVALACQVASASGQTLSQNAGNANLIATRVR
jgi:hypothetical protein